VHSIDPARIIKKIGHLNSEELEHLLVGVRIMLRL
jgi:mRNA-degrading endonuclease toxin of MazEF toxin-antitoxin module